MIITGIELTAKQKYRIEIDGQAAFVLYQKELTTYDIKKGQEISAASYDKILTSVLTPRAKRYVLHLLIKGDKTEHQLIQKLNAQHYPQQAVEQAVAYAKSYGYVDDIRYVHNYISGHCQRLSRKEMQWKLRGKGVSKELFEQLWESCEKPDETEILRQLIHKKIGSAARLDDKATKKIAAALYRKGFQSAQIWSVLKEMDACDNSYQELE